MNLDDMTIGEIEAMLGPTRVREIYDAAVSEAVSDFRAGMLRSSIEKNGEEFTGLVLDFRDLPGGLIVRLELEDGDEVKVAAEKNLLAQIKLFHSTQDRVTFRGVRQRP